MTTIVEFVSALAPVLYFLAAVGVFFSIRGLTIARQEKRVAVFGLEREAALQRQRRALNTIILMAILSGAVYVTTNILRPNIEGTMVIDPTPTSSVFVTTQPTATTFLLLYPTVTVTPDLPPADEANLPPTPDPDANGCEILGANISNPTSGQNVSGQVVVEGQANILNQAQYKFELRGPSTGQTWIVVGTYPNNIVPDGFLGTWDSTSLQPGDYVLRLVVLRDNFTFPTPCEVPIVLTGTGGGNATSP